MDQSYPPVKPGRKPVKVLTARIVFLFLGSAFEYAAKKDPDIKREVDSWEEGFTLMMNVLPYGPYMTLEKKGGQLHFRGLKLKDSNLDIKERIAKDGRVKYHGAKLKDIDVIINFKNIECAFMILTPQMGVPQAYAERRVLVKGDLVKVMSFARALNVLLALLYPRFLCAPLVKRMPPMGFKKQIISLMVLAGSTVGFCKHALLSSSVDI